MTTIDITYKKQTYNIILYIHDGKLKLAVSNDESIDLARGLRRSDITDGGFAASTSDNVVITDHITRTITQLLGSLPFNTAILMLLTQCVIRLLNTDKSLPENIKIIVSDTDILYNDQSITIPRGTRIHTWNIMDKFAFE